MVSRPNLKAILLFFLVLITGPFAIVAYILARLSGRYDDDRFGILLTKLYGWPTEAPTTYSETAWLNGLRGLAATMVMFHHLNGDVIGSFTTAAPFGATLQKDFHYASYINYHMGHQFWEPWRLPILRLFVVSGDAQVAIFFVLSGFVLSWSPLRMLYNGKQEQFGSYLGSLMFRRWFRLYLPCFFVGSLYLAADLIRREHMRSSVGNFFWEIWNFLVRTEEWQRPFYVDRFKVTRGANIAMWTIPWEYAGSVYLVVVLLCAGRFHGPIFRIYSIAALTVYAACTLRWVYALFGSGIVLCDYILYHGGFDELSKSTSVRSRSMWTILMFIGLYFLSFTPPQADSGWDIPGYQWMCFGSTSMDLVRYCKSPSVLVFRASVESFRGLRRIANHLPGAGIGAVLVITGACHFSSIRRLFDASLFQYLGRISFMLYLIHNLIIEHVTLILRDALVKLLIPWQFDEVFKQHIYKTTSLTHFVIWLICTLYTTVFTFLAANWLEIFIDQPCTRFSRTIDKVLTSGTVQKQNHLSSVPPAHPRHLNTDVRYDEESLPLHSIANGHSIADPNSVSRHDS